jgi:hypothetical protein
MFSKSDEEENQENLAEPSAKLNQKRKQVESCVKAGNQKVAGTSDCNETYFRKC